MLILSAHFLADFYFQPNLWAIKNINIKIFMVSYWSVFFVLEICLILCIPFSEAIKAGLFIVSSHFIIDAVKIYIYNRYRNSALIDLAAFCVDQILHIISICVALCLFNLPFYFNGKFEIMCIQFQSEKIMNYLLLIVLLFNPASVFIKNLQHIYLLKIIRNFPIVLLQEV